MKNLYEVEYKSKHTIDGKGAGWSKNEPIHVVANGDITKAARKAVRHLKGRVTRFWEEGARHTDRCVAVKIESINLVASIDVE